MVWKTMIHAWYRYAILHSHPLPPPSRHYLSEKLAKTKLQRQVKEGIDAVIVDSVLAIRQGLKCRHAYLFVNETRRRVGEQGLARMLEEVKAIAGMRGDRRVLPHSIRHAAATREDVKARGLRAESVLRHLRRVAHRDIQRALRVGRPHTTVLHAERAGEPSWRIVRPGTWPPARRSFPRRSPPLPARDGGIPPRSCRRSRCRRARNGRRWGP